MERQSISDPDLFEAFRASIIRPWSSVTVVGPDKGDCNRIGISTIDEIGIRFNIDSELWISVDGEWSLKEDTGDALHFAFSETRSTRVGAPEFDLWETTKWPPYYLSKIGPTNVELVRPRQPQNLIMGDTLIFTYEDRSQVALSIQRLEPWKMSLLFASNSWAKVLQGTAQSRGGNRSRTITAPKC